MLFKFVCTKLWQGYDKWHIELLYFISKVDFVKNQRFVDVIFIFELIAYFLNILNNLKRYIIHIFYSIEIATKMGEWKFKIYHVLKIRDVGWT